MLGAGTTVNEDPLLATPLTVTNTFPVVAPVGTVATIDFALQLVGVAFVPLKVTVLVPWVEPKLLPAMVTEAPTAPEAGDRLVIDGVAALTCRLEDRRKMTMSRMPEKANLSGTLRSNAERVPRFLGVRFSKVPSRLRYG
jgi:hypothetical protein